VHHGDKVFKSPTSSSSPWQHPSTATCRTNILEGQPDDMACKRKRRRTLISNHWNAREHLRGNVLSKNRSKQLPVGQRSCPASSVCLRHLIENGKSPVCSPVFPSWSNDNPSSVNYTCEMSTQRFSGRLAATFCLLKPIKRFKCRMYQVDRCRMTWWTSSLCSSATKSLLILYSVPLGLPKPQLAVAVANKSSKTRPHTREARNCDFLVEQHSPAS